MPLPFMRWTVSWWVLFSLYQSSSESYWVYPSWHPFLTVRRRDSPHSFATVSWPSVDCNPTGFLSCTLVCPFFYPHATRNKVLICYPTIFSARRTPIPLLVLVHNLLYNVSRAPSWRILLGVISPETDLISKYMLVKHSDVTWLCRHMALPKFVLQNDPLAKET